MRLVLAIALASLGGCGSGTSTPAAPPAPVRNSPSAAIWIHPGPAGALPVGGSTDFPSLFAGTTAWPTVAARTSTFGLYAGVVAALDDATLGQIVSFLNAHLMTVELEAPALQATSACGSGVEGYVAYGPGQPSLHDFTLAYLNRLKALGANVAYIKVDEPYFFGSITSDSRSCHWAASVVAQAVAQFAQLAQSVYPNVQVGDVEPIVGNAYLPDVVTALAGWLDVYKTASGSGFPFFTADLDFTSPSWPTLALGLESAAHARGMRFGIIYIGDYPDPSDQVWASKVVARFQSFQETYGATPDFVLFQSWEPHPYRCLPETDPTTFTGVVKEYVDTFGPK
ncbi:MAG: hypothetical protein JO359_00845 [Candidatus Eremiobacteraeota bacterium]|nr:hypothetical protein [Candidatus Eremiobacteraeota bacterium]